MTAWPSPNCHRPYPARSSAGGKGTSVSGRPRSPTASGAAAGEPSLRAWKAAMTARRNFKNQVRARAARTGESYTSFLRHFTPEAIAPEPRKVALAVAQTRVRTDPGNAEALRESGREVRALMRGAGRSGA